MLKIYLISYPKWITKGKLSFVGCVFTRKRKYYG